MIHVAARQPEWALVIDLCTHSVAPASAGLHGCWACGPLTAQHLREALMGRMWHILERPSAAAGAHAPTKCVINHSHDAQLTKRCSTSVTPETKRSSGSRTAKTVTSGRSSPSAAEELIALPNSQRRYLEIE